MNGFNQKLFAVGQIKNSKGVALIQALLVSVVITLLALRFSYTAQDQIETSAKVDNLVEARMTLRSVQDGILYLLATQQSPETQYFQGVSFESLNTWGEPVVLFSNDKMKVTVSIQDNSGLLSLQVVKLPAWRHVLEAMALTEEEVAEFVGVVSDWQDQDTNHWQVGAQEPTELESGIPYRNNRIQLISEIALVTSLTSEDWQKIAKISTPISSYTLNVNQSPNDLIHFLFEPTAAQNIIEQRKNGTLTKETIIESLGPLYNEFDFGFYPSENFKVTVQVDVSGIKYEETLEVGVATLTNQPVEIFTRSKPI